MNDINNTFYSTAGEDRFRYNARRSHSINSPDERNVREGTHSEVRSLKLAGRSTITFPKRERFNENTQQVIAEQRALNNSLSKNKLERTFG